MAYLTLDQTSIHMKLNRRSIKMSKAGTFYRMRSLTLLFIFFTFFSCAQEQKPLNIIWIVSDDLGVDLGAYGEKAVQTPHLDEFAKEAVRYTNFHTSAPVCSPSRSGMITGMYPISIDCHQHRTSYKKQLPQGVQPISAYFKNSGYYVTNGNNKLKGKGKTDYNFNYQFDELFDGVDYRESSEGKLVFSQIQIFLPHRPFHEDEENPVNPSQVTIPPYYPDHPITRKDWALYLETVQNMDAQFGAVMDRLKQDGMLDNSIIFFFGDQGRPHLRAKQFLYDQGTNTPLMVRWPNKKGAGTVSEKLVSNIDLAVASLKQAGIPVPEHLPGVDFLDDNVERQFLFTAKDRMDGTIDRQRAVRSKRFKYIRNFYPEKSYAQFNTYKKTSYPVLTLMQVLQARGELTSEQAIFMRPTRPKEELYDLENDPYELENLADNAKFRKVLKKHSSALDKFLKKHDRGVYPENQEELDRAVSNMEKAYERKLIKMGLPRNASSEDFLTYWEEKLLSNE